MMSSDVLWIKIQQRKLLNFRNVKKMESNWHDEWLKSDKTVNPITKRKISSSGSVSKTLDRLFSTASQYESTWQNSLAHRLQFSKKVVAAIDQANFQPGKMCMSGKNATSKFESVQLIGSGTFGNAYKVKLNPLEEFIVIKEATFTTLDKSPAWKKKSSYPQEYFIDELITDLLKNHRMQNALITYNIKTCDNCLLGKKPSVCYEIFMEMATMTLKDYFKEFTITSLNHLLSLVYQTLIGVWCMHRYYGLFHRDIKDDNVFVKLIQPGGFFEYVIDGNVYYVENFGAIVLLADFGASDCLMPKFATTKFFGQRNARVEFSKGEYFFKPLVCQFTIIGFNNPVLVKAKQKPWYNRRGNYLIGTKNTFWLGKDLKPSFPVDLNDSKIFPATECLFDLQDAIAMYTGGKQALQSGHHYGPRKCKTEIIERVKQMFGGKKIVYPIYTDQVYVLRADLLLKKIYIPPSGTVSILERFIID